jgi:hypothetical protein
MYLVQRPLNEELHQNSRYYLLAHSTFYINLGFIQNCIWI